MHNCIMLWPDSQLPACIKTGLAGGTRLHIRIRMLARERWLPSYCRIGSKSLPPVLCRCPVDVREHSMYSYSYTRDVGCLSAVSRLPRLSYANTLYLLTSMAINGYSGWRPSSYQASRCFGGGGGGGASSKVGWVANQASLLQNGSPRFKTGRVANCVVT